MSLLDECEGKNLVAYASIQAMMVSGMDDPLIRRLRITYAGDFGKAYSAFFSRDREEQCEGACRACARTDGTW